MDLPRQILEGTPYPVKAVLAFGMNYRMFPDCDTYMKKALEQVDFFVDVDLFQTDTSRYADIVLPACTSFEREEFKSYPGGYAYYTKPVIPPLYQSRSDTDIMCDLARAMDLPDPLLKAGYRACLEYILSPVSFTVDQLQQAGPVGLLLLGQPGKSGLGVLLPAAGVGLHNKDMLPLGLGGVNGSGRDGGVVGVFQGRQDQGDVPRSP